MAPPALPQAHPPLQGSARALGTVALSAATFMNVLDSSIANVSLPAIAGDLGVSPNQGTWVITSFAVSNGIAVPLTGWLMIRFAGWDATQSWLVSCYWLYGAAVLCWLSAAMLQIAIRGQARIAVEQAAPLSQRYQGLIRAWFALSGSASLALAAAYSLMLTQPQLW